MPHAEDFEGKLAADYIVFSEDVRHTQAGSAVRDIHKNFFRTMATVRAANLRIQPASSCAQSSNKKESDET
jgi:hypothetical protein